MRLPGQRVVAPAPYDPDADWVDEDGVIDWDKRPMVIKTFPSEGSRFTYSRDFDFRNLIDLSNIEDPESVEGKRAILEKLHSWEHILAFKAAIRDHVMEVIRWQVFDGEALPTTTEGHRDVRRRHPVQ